MTTPIRVGIIGVSANSGWARESHVPAVQQLSGVELVAVASSDQAKADAAAKAFGVGKSYASGAEMIRDPDIDLVAVCVRVPDHRELVLAAAATRKHIYSESPLGSNRAEAEEMREAADASGVHTAIGLQTRANPAVLRARELFASGAIGRPLTAHVYSSTIGFGRVVPAPDAYLEDPANGVNLITIQGAHTFDLAISLLGGLENLQALLTAQYPEIELGEEHTRQKRLTSDHMLVQARLTTGGALSLEVAGGRPPNTPFQFQVIGDRGILTLDGGAPRGFQSGRLRLSINGEAQQVNESELASMPDAAVNVAGIYASLRDDIQNGTFNTAGFAHAVQVSRLFEDVLSSAQAGSRALPMGWPVS